MNAPVLTLDTLEHAFMGSPFFPVRVGDRIDVTEDMDGESVVVAAVRLQPGGIVVEQVGKGKRAVANAKRVAALFEDSKRPSAEPCPPAPTYAIRPYQDVGGMAPEHARAGLGFEDVLAWLKANESVGTFGIVDESDGELACAYSFGLVTSSALECVCGRPGCPDAPAPTYSVYDEKQGGACEPSRVAAGGGATFEDLLGALEEAATREDPPTAETEAVRDRFATLARVALQTAVRAKDAEALTALRAIGLVPIVDVPAPCSNPECEDGMIVKEHCATCEGPIWETCPTCNGTGKAVAAPTPAKRRPAQGRRSAR